MRYLRYILFFTAILLVPLSSCSPKHKASSAKKKTEKVEAKRRKEADKTIKKAQKQHLKNQSPNTRSRMKANRRKSDEWSGKKPPFYVRWWRAIRKPN
jgi:Flp pilus assembly protein TadB